MHGFELVPPQLGGNDAVVPASRGASADRQDAFQQPIDVPPFVNGCVPVSPHGSAEDGFQKRHSRDFRRGPEQKVRRRNRVQDRLEER